MAVEGLLTLRSFARGDKDEAAFSATAASFGENLSNVGGTPGATGFEPFGGDYSNWVISVCSLAAQEPEAGSESEESDGRRGPPGGVDPTDENGIVGKGDVEVVTFYSFVTAIFLDALGLFGLLFGSIKVNWIDDVEEHHGSNSS